MGAFLTVDFTVNIKVVFLDFIVAAVAFGKPFTLHFQQPITVLPLAVIVGNVHLHSPAHCPAIAFAIPGNVLLAAVALFPGPKQRVS